MKFVLVGPSHPWRGGIAHHTDQLAFHLSSRHEVQIVTFTRQYPALLFPGKSQLEPDTRGPGVPVNRWIDSLNPITWIRTAFRIRKSAPDFVLFAWSIPFFGICYGFLAAILKRHPSTRVGFLCHNVIPHERRPGDRTLTRFAFRFSRFYLVMSKAVENDLLDLVPGATVVLSHHPVYNRFGESEGKEEARRTLGLSSKRIILFFGYVRRYKGLTVLLNALSRVDDVFLLIAGEFYEPEERYSELIRSLGIDERVRIVNRYIPSDDVSTYFSASDVVILPYLSATQSGIVQIAYNFGTPVIASDIGGLSEMIRDGVTGRLVPPGDPDSLADAIRSFYRNNETERMITGIAEARRQYSWEALVQALETLTVRAGS